MHVYTYKITTFAYMSTHTLTHSGSYTLMHVYIFINTAFAYTHTHTKTHHHAGSHIIIHVNTFTNTTFAYMSPHIMLVRTHTQEHTVMLVYHILILS